MYNQKSFIICETYSNSTVTIRRPKNISRDKIFLCFTIPILHVTILNPKKHSYHFIIQYVIFNSDVVIFIQSANKFSNQEIHSFNDLNKV